LLRELLSRLWRKWFLSQRGAKSLYKQQFGGQAESSGGSKGAVLKLEVPEGVDDLNENLKRLIKELGEAINGSLSESEEIADAIAKIKSQGYDVLLVLEATIGFSKREEDADDNGAMVTAPAKNPEFRVSAQDVKFLKSLRISIDDAA
jgi:hypothetical protein